MISCSMHSRGPAKRGSPRSSGRGAGISACRSIRPRPVSGYALPTFGRLGIGTLPRLFVFLYLSFLPYDSGRTAGQRPSIAERTRCRGDAANRLRLSAAGLSSAEARFPGRTRPRLRGARGEGSRDIRRRTGMDSRRVAGKSEPTPEPVSSPGKPACPRILPPGAPTLFK